MTKIHYHSDCQFFAGCENMLTNFFNSEEIRMEYTISFSYRNSIQYTQGFEQRLKCKIPVYPIKFPYLPDSSQLPIILPFFARRLIMFLLRFTLNGPFFTYEVFILYRLFKKIKPDIVHINNGGYPAALSARAAAFAAQLGNVPTVIMVVNNLAIDYNRLSRWFDYPIDRLVARSVNLFITGSKAAAEQLRFVLDLSMDRVKSIHNGIHLRNTTSSLSDTRKRLAVNDFDGILFGVVALLDPRKGHQVLLEAILELVTHSSITKNNFHVLIEGEGPLRYELTDFVVSHQLDDFVTFVGHEENIFDFMSILDVLILPSIQNEDFPNMILEAMALGKPVIASRIAGTPEQVMEGVTGLLVEPRNVSQLANALNLLKENKNLRCTMGTAALSYFNTHFTSKIAVRSYMDIYQQQLNLSQYD